MRIVHLAAGAGQMYCGACNRDMALMRQLLSRGHDVQIIPLYTPLRIESGDVKTTAIFLGGINAFLQQHLNIFHHTPAFLDRLFDHPGLLRWASGRAVQTSARQLGPMTVSVLEGCDGRQRKELQRLIEFLKCGHPPDVFSITNSLLSAIAPELKAAFDVPVVCGLQGEDEFIERMSEPYTSEARDLVRANAAEIDLFTATTAKYADEMSEYFDIDRGCIHVVRTGFDVEPYCEIAENRGATPATQRPSVIGYLSVIAPTKGLDLLVDAWIELARADPEVRLQVAGRVLDAAYWREIDQCIARAGLRSRLDFRGEVDMEGKLRFLGECTLFCMPSQGTERRGLAALEALASGLPVVVPDTGVFPEMMERTGGGCLFESGDHHAIRDRLAHLLSDRRRSRVRGLRASEKVRQYYRAELAVDEMLGAIERVTQEKAL